MGDELKELALEVESVLSKLEGLDIESRHEKQRVHNLIEVLENGVHRFEEEELGEFSLVEHQG